MAFVASPNPWPPHDCSQGICTINCPQWCYIEFPPPSPSFFLDRGNRDGECDSSNSNFSPLLIALIRILTSALIFISYYTVISKFCHQGRNNSRHHDCEVSSTSNAWQGDGAPRAVASGVDVLDKALIKSITVYKFKKRDKFVECIDCSVYLSEFKENERFRLLPKCNHTFHIHCINT